MPPKSPKTLLTTLILSTFIIFYLSTTFLPLSPKKVTNFTPISPHSHCNLFKGKWVFDPNNTTRYDETCPFHRTAWNCLKNKSPKMGTINSYKWAPQSCKLGEIDAIEFMGLMRNKKLGFVGDSLNENFWVAFVCVLRNVDFGGKKWKKFGAWRGVYFPRFNFTVGYHRAVLLSNYQWQENKSGQDGLRGTYRVDVDVPANDWIRITKFYDVLVFNTGHWWGPHKFPKETPLVFYQNGRLISPPLDFMDGLKVVLKSMMSYIDKEVPSSTLKFWRLQSPRHFFGGEWNQNGSCLFDEPLQESQLDMWFDPSNNGVNKEAREINQVIEEALRGSSIQKLDLTHLSEYRADAHPAIWLGKKDAVAVWGQDCMHWCLPGVPDTWVDILGELIRRHYAGYTYSV
ncbi:hypothetical protein vseg_007088 [Gypsophila vaccaria]